MWRVFSLAIRVALYHMSLNKKIPSFLLVAFIYFEGCKSQAFIGRRKEMFYLTMHSTHFIYGYMVSGLS